MYYITTLVILLIDNQMLNQKVPISVNCLVVLHVLYETAYISFCLHLNNLFSDTLVVIFPRKNWKHCHRLLLSSFYILSMILLARERGHPIGNATYKVIHFSINCFPIEQLLSFVTQKGILGLITCKQRGATIFLNISATIALLSIRFQRVEVPDDKRISRGGCCHFLSLCCV